MPIRCLPHSSLLVATPLEPHAMPTRHLWYEPCSYERCLYEHFLYERCSADSTVKSCLYTYLRSLPYVLVGDRLVAKSWTNPFFSIALLQATVTTQDFVGYTAEGYDPSNTAVLLYFTQCHWHLLLIYLFFYCAWPFCLLIAASTWRYVFSRGAPTFPKFFDK